MSYLLEYTTQKPFDPQHLPAERMTNAAACSSIEYVAWGLEYYDLARLITNVWFSRSGTQQPDRNWALGKAFNRNLDSPLCKTSGSDLPGLQPRAYDGESLTLGRGAFLLLAKVMPAFTLNTTTVETGGRFLLSNYQIPKNLIPGSDLLPSESFLHAYGEPCEGSPHQGYKYADLPIATAARLSATFPFVSSASRVPARYASHAYHFVDGGYYDNDGTGSVIEFLNAALIKADPRTPPVGQDPCFKPSAAEPAASPASQPPAREGTKPLNILLVEIRNGDDLDPLDNVDDLAHQTHPKNLHDWNAISQLSAPGGALWKAGHESVTRRNRLGLCLLETSFPENLVIHHVIFNFDIAPRRPDSKELMAHDVIEPLNWHLTAGEREDIHKQAMSDETTAAIEHSKNWVRYVLNPTPSSPDPSLITKPCHVAYVRLQHPISPSK